MLTNWNPARMPEKDEMKLRLSTARKQLYDLQMKIKEHKIHFYIDFLRRFQKQENSHSWILAGWSRSAESI